MKLETRLTILLGALFACALGALGALRWAQYRSTQAVQLEIAADKSRQLARAMTLNGSTLERFASDYTQWDEMCTFVANPSADWAAINIDQSLASWRFHGAWVFNTERHEIYRRLREPVAAADLAGFPTPDLVRRLCGRERLHFFTSTARGLLEVRTAPIHPSDDARLNDPPAGWFMVARLWEADDLAQLGMLLDSTVSLTPPSDPAPSAARVETTYPLSDWQGAPRFSLHVRHTSPLLGNMISYDADEVLLFVIVGVSFLLATGWFLHRWVRQPLRTIEASLAGNRPELVANLRARRDEFARVAALIGTAGDQRRALQVEIDQRTAAEANLRRALDERIALGRDLHDGVIQSIYATGMTLQGIGPLLHSDAHEARRRLETCIAALNTTIAQLRGHIAGLDANAGAHASLADGLQKLLHEMRPARAVAYDVHLDPLLAAALPPDTVVQLLFIAREAASNALRHSGASRIALRLDIVNGDPVFLVEDDGAGFDPAATPRRGHGLDNMTRRAEESGAAFVIDSIPGRGTRLRVELPWAGLDIEHKSAHLPSS